MDLSDYQLLSKQLVCNLYCNPGEGVIYQEWLTTSYGDGYRNILLELLDIQKENSISKVIVNGKELGELDEEDIEWTQNRYTPMSLEEGLKFIAFVVSDDDYHAMQQADVLMEAENAGLVTKFFNDVDEACSWIGSR